MKLLRTTALTAALITAAVPLLTSSAEAWRGGGWRGAAVGWRGGGWGWRGAGVGLAAAAVAGSALAASSYYGYGYGYPAYGYGYGYGTGYSYPGYGYGTGYNYPAYGYGTGYTYPGTDLSDLAAARSHAFGVAQELMFRSQGMLDHDWSLWRMLVHDDDGKELFSFPMVAIEDS